MGAFYWEEAWIKILAKQEQKLRYSEFTREMALDLGLKIVQLAKATYHKSPAMRIVEDGTTIFAYKMDKTSLENDWWMDRKLAVSRMTGMSSLRSYAESEAGLIRPGWLERPDNFAACGGCIPVLPSDGSAPYIHVLASGMEHFEDHQIIADAMAWQLGVEIPRIDAKL